MAALLALGTVAVRPAHATPWDALPVHDPIYAELRLLDLYDSSILGGRIHLPHPGTTPLRIDELQGASRPAVAQNPVVRISLGRLERVLGRDASSTFAPNPDHGFTPRLLQFSGVEDQRLELSAGLEGSGELSEDSSRFVSGSGAQARFALTLDRWLVYTHLLVGQVDRARRFADPIVPNNDLILHSEDTYLAYVGRGGRWGGRFGRSRWHWGPGREGSLILSKTAPAMTGVSLDAGVRDLGIHIIALNATVDQAAGEQLAAHRLEWQPVDYLRLGITESARYGSESWQPLYLVGVIPYILVQRFLLQDAPDSLGRLRNNIMMGFDVAWRIAPGTRVYGELVIDDLHAETGANPNKLAWQLGWEGAGGFLGGRLTWGGEFTRIWRFVYTSFFDREYSIQGEPLGFPTGPDVRRLMLHGAWDPNVDWQVFGSATVTDKGENDLGEPFIPRSPGVRPETFEGIVERSRSIDAGLRWWPAGGVDVALRGGYEWIDNVGHVDGMDRSGARGAVIVRLTR